MTALDEIIGTDTILKSFAIFGRGCEIIEGNGPYVIVYDAKKTLSKEDRKSLAELGWRSERHSRTGKEMWVLYFAEMPA